MKKKIAARGLVLPEDIHVCHVPSITFLWFNKNRNVCMHRQHTYITYFICIKGKRLINSFSHTSENT